MKVRLTFVEDRNSSSCYPEIRLENTLSLKKIEIYEPGPAFLLFLIRGVLYFNARLIESRGKNIF